MLISIKNKIGNLLACSISFANGKVDLFPPIYFCPIYLDRYNSIFLSASFQNDTDCTPLNLAPIFLIILREEWDNKFALVAIDIFKF